MKTAKICLALLAASARGFAAGDSMTGMTGPNYVINGRFEQTEEVAYPWTGVDEGGFLRKAVQERGVNIYIDKSNQFSYDHFANSASLVDLDGDRLPDLVAPDGAGFFWFWKNVGTPGNPQFGLGEVMPLLVDNELSRYGAILPGENKKQLSAAEVKDKERIDLKRKKVLERLERENRSRGKGQQRTARELEEAVEDELPYPWEAAQPDKPGTTLCKLNGFRQLRAVAAPCDWDGNGLTDFLVGDAQGTIYFAKNLGRPGFPDFRTYTKTKDRLVLKLAPSYNLVTRKTTREPVEFMNYATPFVCDWDRNGVPDILVGEGTYSVNAVRLFLNPSRTALSANECNLVFGESRTFLSPFAWDWDGDGWLDLFVNDADGRLTVFANPGGKYASGRLEMADSKDLFFEEKPDTSFLKFCCPQPCDWNADGIMDLLWADPFGRIFYALGKTRGGLGFGTPVAIRSNAGERLKRLNVPTATSFCAVPVGAALKSDAGGTADAQRFISQEGGGAQNKNGWPARMDNFHGLMPGWIPGRYAESGNSTGQRQSATKMAASWAIAPVPYEVFNVLKDDSSAPGQGRTFFLSWHNPATNAVFRQSRDAVTRFGHGAAYSFKVKGASDQLMDANVRVSFFIKLEGKFERLSVLANTAYLDGPKGNFIDGGRITFKTLTPPPVGKWFQYESVVAKGKYGREPGDIHLRLLGRGNVSIRDVALSTTGLAADAK